MLNGYRRFSAFTLVELLVVIAIISVLASMLLPVLVSARNSAVSITCSSNFKQMGVLLSLYANDFNEHYPRGKEVIGGAPYTWASVIRRVTMGNDSGGEWSMNTTSTSSSVAADLYSQYAVFRCPAVARGESERRCAPMQQVYGMNASMTGSWLDWRLITSGSGLTPLKVNKLGKKARTSGLGFYVYKKPSRLIVLADTYGPKDNDSGCALYCDTGSPGQFYWFSVGALRPQLRHNNCLQALMLDGSSQSLSLSELSGSSSGNATVYLDSATPMTITGEARFR